jgi:hypothetical protein
MGAGRCHDSLSLLPAQQAGASVSVFLPQPCCVYKSDICLCSSDDHTDLHASRFTCPGSKIQVNGIDAPLCAVRQHMHIVRMVATQVFSKQVCKFLTKCIQAIG